MDLLIYLVLFTTCCGIKFFEALYTNNDVFMDTGSDDPEVYSWTLEDNTGNLYIAGHVRAQGGINVENGKFIMEGISGDTTIGPALIRPNGGIVVDDLVFSADIDGNIFTAGTAYFGDDVFFGTNDESERTIARIPATGASGGTTYFCGQNADAIGGDLYLQPGFGAIPGDIILGNEEAVDLYFGRSSLSNGVSGGVFTFAGQTSLNGNGGKVILSAGDSFFDDDGGSDIPGLEDDFDGGSIYLAPGLPDGAGIVGKLIIGSTGRNSSGADLIIGRPALTFGEGADTFLAGQTTTNGVGGNFYLQAGNVRSGNGIPGDLILGPGDSLNRGQANIFLGRDIATPLTITRVPVAGAAGYTKLIGQGGLAGKGGALIISGGDAEILGAGGNLWIIPGTSETAEAGNIFWGRPDDHLVVTRVASDGFGLDTAFFGQDSFDAAGGDFGLFAGKGHFDGGDLTFESGIGSEFFGTSGDIIVSAGDSLTTYGGDIYIEAGESYREGGSVFIIAGDSDTLIGGDVIFTAGSGNPNGDIVIGPAVNAFVFNGVTIHIHSGLLFISGGNDLVVITSNDPDNGIIFWNGVQLIRSPPLVPPFPIFVGVTTTDIQTLAGTISDIVDSLAICRGGHGLITLVDLLGQIIC